MIAASNQCWLMFGRYFKQIFDGQKSDVIVNNQKEAPLPFEIKKRNRRRSLLENTSTGVFPLQEIEAGKHL